MSVAPGFIYLFSGEGEREEEEGKKEKRSRSLFVVALPLSFFLSLSLSLTDDGHHEHGEQGRDPGEPRRGPGVGGGAAARRSRV